MLRYCCLLLLVGCAALAPAQPAPGHGQAYRQPIASLSYEQRKRVKRGERGFKDRQPGRAGAPADGLTSRPARAIGAPRRYGAWDCRGT